MRLLLFNPETEYALASGASFYTPPKRVENLRKENQLLPEAWADTGDMILVDDPETLTSRFRLIGWDMLDDLFRKHADIEIEPWGWNHALIRRLKDHGVPEKFLPDAPTMDRIRDLAHRHTTIALNTQWNEAVDENLRVDLPKELQTEGECMEFYRGNPGCWMKAPWSSSGRGVINTSADMNGELVRQWCHGILRRQGSVIGETGADKIADYATEWRMEHGIANYLGLSSFNTSNRGKYISNNTTDQRRMIQEFNDICDLDIDRLIMEQKTILEKVLTGYEGMLGVDILVEHDGSVRPFVELNLRRTMGMLYIQE